MSHWVQRMIMYLLDLGCISLCTADDNVCVKPGLCVSLCTAHDNVLATPKL